MSQELNSKSIWTVNQNSNYSIAKTKANELVMAWAVDRESRKPIYIFELDASRRGAKCECLCVSCDMPLTAVNVAKSDYIQRPHFKHPKGAQRDSCLVLAARFAIAQQLLEQGYVELPQRKVSSRIVGLSGKEYEAWEVKPSERVRVVDTYFDDQAKAILTLDDGRKIIVTLTGGVADVTNEGDSIVANISIETGNDLSIAGMSPEELKDRMTLLWAGACWNSHWSDSELLDISKEGAKSQAVEGLDWLVDDGSISGIERLTNAQKSETLLHLEVKRILERERRIHLPELVARVQKEVPSSQEYSRETKWPAEIVILHDVRLEQRLNRIVPDVIATVIDSDSEGQHYSLAIEVTVTNTIDEERMQRIRSANLATLEIDLSRLGGLVTREELNELVVQEVVGKRWLHHPKIAPEIIKLNATLDHELMRLQKRNLIRANYRETPVEKWANRFEEAYIEYKALKETWYKLNKETVQDNPLAPINKEIQIWEDRLEDTIFALSGYGFPQANIHGNNRIESILDRLFSIKLNTVVGYNFDTCWQVINTCQMDGDDSKTWHTLYLIAINQYKPAVNWKQNQKILKWRQEVKDSIDAGNEEYLRSTKYDAFLSLLFPEIKAGLKKSYGKKSIESKPKYEQYTQSYSISDYSEGFWLKGKALEEWKRRYPESAKMWFGN